MPFIEITQKYFSDLVFHELDPSVGYSRQDLNVTPPAGGAAITLGTVVWRAKADTNTDKVTSYAVLSAASQVDDANEFAIVYGDHYGFNPSFVPRAVVATRFNAVGFVGRSGGLQLKDELVKEFAQLDTGANLTDAQYEALKELLKKQGIILEVTLGA